MKKFCIVLLIGLSISLRSLRILLGIGVVVGVIVTYTAYKAAPIVKDSISNVVRNDFANVSIKQTSLEGIRIIGLYDSAVNNPDLAVLNLAYKSVAKEVEDRSDIARITGESAFEGEALANRMNFFRLQINYINQPIMSGFILGLSTCLLIYSMLLIVNGLKATFRYIMHLLKGTRKTAH